LVNLPNCSPLPQPNTIVGQVCNVKGQNIVCRGNVQELESSETVVVSATATGIMAAQCHNPRSKSNVPGGNRFTGTQQFTATRSITVISGDSDPSQLDAFNFPLTMLLLFSSKRL
jgi:hypothetical protein